MGLTFSSLISNDLKLILRAYSSSSRLLTFLQNWNSKTHASSHTMHDKKGFIPDEPERRGLIQIESPVTFMESMKCKNNNSILHS